MTPRGHQIEGAENKRKMGKERVGKQKRKIKDVFCTGVEVRRQAGAELGSTLKLETVSWSTKKLSFCLLDLAQLFVG